MTQECVIRRIGRAGRITLNRPAALNAITHSMVHAMQAALVAWEADDQVELVAIDGAGGKAFAAGGDLKSLYDTRPGGPAEDADYHLAFWRDEYRLNATIKRYPKPYVALMDGIVMGGGIGVSAHGSHRVVTEASRVAMPETGVGLIPDVGGTWILSRPELPPGLGAFVGLTGARLGAGEAIAVGFADTFVPRVRLPELINQLESGTKDVSETCRAFADTKPAAPLLTMPASVLEAFTSQSASNVVDRLNSLEHDEAAKACQTLQEKSPLSTAVTLRALREGAHYTSFESALSTEFRLVHRCYTLGDFHEGIRAAVIEKDRSPQWRHKELSAVSEDAIDAFFAPLLATIETPF